MGKTWSRDTILISLFLSYARQPERQGKSKEKKTHFRLTRRSKTSLLKLPVSVHITMTMAATIYFFQQ